MVIGDSTRLELALLYFKDEIRKNMDDKDVSVIVLLDMYKAFDSIRHDLTLSKLQSIGVPNTACDWFGSHLSQRIQVVNVANSLSDPLRPWTYHKAQFLDYFPTVKLLGKEYLWPRIWV